jgi:ketosteroid isomerase-like protein
MIMSVSTKTKLEEDIHAAMVKWIDTIEGREISNLSEVVYQDQDLVWVGIDKDDWLRGYSELEQALIAQNNALHNIRISVSEETIHVSPDEHFAWATNQWTFCAQAGEQYIEMPVRCTWILEKREADWKIVHFHKSVGMSG